MLAARVVVEKAVYGIDKKYDYAVPDNLKGVCLAGCRVTIPFGRGNVARLGLVMELAEIAYSDDIKQILTVADQTPVLNEEMLGLVEWLKENTFCTYFEALKCVLPNGINMKMVPYLEAANKKNENLTDQEHKIIEYLCLRGRTSLKKLCDEFGISPDGSLLKKLIKNGNISKTLYAEQNMDNAVIKTVKIIDENGSCKLTEKQRLVYDFLKEQKIIALKDLENRLGVSAVTVKSLEKKGLVSIFDEEYYRTAYKGVKVKKSKINLTPVQKKAFDGLLNQYNSNKASTALLYGVTGSGKTSVFLKLVDRAIEDGKSAIVMVPEIALTPQTLSLFYERYGDGIAVFHSALSLGQRMDEYKRAQEGKVKVAIGTRSAVFAPLKNIGVIIIDEEQEHTYKSEQSPRFYTKDVARYRCAYHNALLLLASATPSFESYALAKSGRYALYELNERYGDAILPDVYTVDMREEVKRGNNGIFSEMLADEIRNTLQQKKQAILLLNRRGHNTYVSCPSCGYVFECKNCSISMTYHSSVDKLICHYCGSASTTPEKCPSCGNQRLRFSGFGTQKAQEELSLLFPEAKILRLDADSTTAKDSFERLLGDFGRHKYDILIGTQMVAKGLNYPDVTLVGVLCADNAMYIEDFRAYERAFSLFTQVIGRSGRGSFPGKAIIQTSCPDSDVIKMAEKQDFPGFYEQEIQTRKLMVYPPYCDIVLLGFVSDKKEISHNGAMLALKIIKEKSVQFGDVKLIALGPSPASVPVVANKYRYRIILKTKNNKKFRSFINEVLLEYYNNEKNCSVFVDINPESIM